MWPLTTTDEGMTKLAKLKNLITLELSRTPLTDARLKELVGLKNLTKVGLSYTKVTGAGMKELIKALPKYKVYP